MTIKKESENYDWWEKLINAGRKNTNIWSFVSRIKDKVMNVRVGETKVKQDKKLINILTSWMHIIREPLVKVIEELNFWDTIINLDNQEIVIISIEWNKLKVKISKDWIEEIKIILKEDILNIIETVIKSKNLPEKTLWHKIPKKRPIDIVSSWTIFMRLIDKFIREWRKFEREVLKKTWTLSSEYYNLETYKKVLNLPEKFNSLEWLKNIKSLTRESRSEEFKKWKEKLKTQLDLIASIPNSFKLEADKYDYISWNKQVILEYIILKYLEIFEELSIEQRIQVIDRMYRYITNKTNVNKYLEDPKYKNNPNQLIADIIWIDSSKIMWNIEVENDGANLTFYINDVEDYYYIRNNWKWDTWSIGFATKKSKIEELWWTFAVINSSKSNEDSMAIKNHEVRHLDDIIISEKLDVFDALSSAKMEILANLTEGYNIDSIKDILKLWIYDYYNDFKLIKRNSETYKKFRQIYEKELSIALNIAKKIQEANIPNYIDLLAITPVRQWGMLYDIYL